MGLFGLFYTAFGLGCKGVSSIKNILEDEENKTIYRDNECNTYLDHNATRRDLDTNHRMSIEHASNGDIWLRDTDTGRYVRNLTDERAERKYQEEKAKAACGKSDRTHIQYGTDEHRQDEFPGYRYKDFKTGKLYVARKMIFTLEHMRMLNLWCGTSKFCGLDVPSKSCDGFCVLFDINSKKIVRLTDGTLESMLGMGALMEDIKAFFPKYVSEYEEKMKNPDWKWYKDRLYYSRPIDYYKIDALNDKYIERLEAKVRRRREEKR